MFGQVLSAGGQAQVAPPPAASDAPAFEFEGGFAQLHDQIGDVMGQPVEKEHPVADTEVQATTTGLAVYRSGGEPTFTDGWTTWMLHETPPVAASTSTESTPSTGPPSSVWTRLAACESTGRWAANTGNGYYGGLQEDMTFWRNYGGTAYAARPDLATPEQQIDVAIRGQAAQGWTAWPICSKVIGVR